jgi:hypothetical protein
MPAMTIVRLRKARDPGGLLSDAEYAERWRQSPPASDEKRRCGRCFYDGTAPNTAEHAMCEAEGGHQWTADASRDSQAQTEETS